MKELIIWATGNVFAGMQCRENSDWRRELCEFVIEAARKNKLIQCTAFTYEYLIFTPEALAQKLIEGKFQWGVVNWRMIECIENQKEIQAGK